MCPMVFSPSAGMNLGALTDTFILPSMVSLYFLILVEAENITIALGKALQYIEENYRDKEKRGIEQIVIWNVGIVAGEDVF